MANPAPTINQINAFNATQGTTIDFNIIGGTELIRSNRIYIYDLSDNSLICTHLYVSTESIHELPPNTDGSIVYESGKSSADFVNGAQYYAQIQTYTDTNGTQGGSGLSVAKMFWCLGDPTLTITTIPSTISTTSYNISATYTDTSASVVSNIIQQYQFNLYSATGSLLQSSGVVVGSGTQQGTSDVYDISYNFTGLNVGGSYYVTVDVTTTQGMSVTTQSNTFTVSIDTPTLGEATVVNNACDGYISVTSNLSGEYGGSGSGEIVSFETDSENVFSKLQVGLEPVQEGSGDPSPTNVRPIRGHSEVDVNVVGKNFLGVKKGTSGTSGGVTATINEDGSITLNGTATSNTVVIGNLAIGYFGWGAGQNDGKKHIPNGRYIIATGLTINIGVRLQVYGTNQSSGIGDISAIIQTAVESMFTIDDTYAYNYVRLFVEAGTYDNVTIKPMIRLASETDPTYEPYQGQTTTQDFNATLTPTSTDTTPYLFKAVGDVYGDRLEDKIVGGTVAWNQMIPDSNRNYTNTSETDTRSYFQFMIQEAVSPYTKYVSQRFYTAIGEYSVLFKPSSSATGVLFKHDGASTNLVMYRGSNLPLTANHVYMFAADFKSVDVTTIGGVVVQNLQFFDLTQMFGSTIADYIYSLEQSQAGAGVAWFKKLFPKDYYAYNAGELLSVGGLQSHDAVGFNIFDGETEVGTINTSGQNAYDATRFRTKNYLPVVPNTEYYVRVDYSPSFDGTLRFYCYDVDKNFIENTNWKGTPSTLTLTTPVNCRYVRFIGTIQRGISYTQNDICINLSNPSRNGEYEPYEKHSYPLDSSLTLRGIPKLDASNNLYYDGDEYTSDGKVKRKYGVVDLGTLNWTYVSAGTRFSAELPKIKTVANNDTKANIVCPLYVTGTPNDTWNSKDKVISANISSHTILVRDTAYTDAATFKAAMSGVMLVYELATPTTETATPYTNPQIVSKYGTLEYVTNSIVPVGHKTTYLTRDIFGGYVDLISGKLVVTHEVTMMDSTWDWIMYQFSADGGITANQFYVDNKIPLPVGGREILCNAFNPILINDRNHYNMSAYLSSSGYCFRYDGITSVADWKTFLATNEIFVYHELATPQTYQLTPQQVNTLVGTNNVWSEQGNIELSYHIPITNLLVKRQDVDDVSGGWLTLYSQPISQASDMDFTFIDFLNQYGKTYKYALVPLLTQTQSGVEVEVEGGYTVSNEVQSVFDGVFIADSTGSQKCKANVGYGNVDMNQVVGSITPIGAKYPIIITNSQNQYHNGSISGTIVPDDYYFNGNLSRIDMVNKRNELEQFFTNKRVKVIKDWNGNIWLVMIAGNVSCTFNNNYGMGIVSFSTNWTEVGDPTNQQDLQATGLINVGGV